ncbi:MAG TPA: DUF1616 domain-containing protein [Thermoplasmata archaeon]|nr:DUF1616 domain-containing protein [Thermoplasmata archaeon]
MRLQFQARPADLYGVFAYTLVVSAGLLLTGGPNPLGLALVFVIPGYLAMAALLPRADQGDWTLRIGLSVGLSLALLAFLGLALNFTPWGISFTSVTLADLGLSVGLGLLAYGRRMAVPVAERMGVALDGHAARWKEYSLLEKGLTVLLVIILAIMVPLLAVSLTQPRPTPSFTELYLLGPAGNFSAYPWVLNVSQPATAVVGVSNHEGASVGYTLRVDLLGVQKHYNATAGVNETVVVNQTTWSWFNFTLMNGGSWNRSYMFSIPAVGTWWVAFDLFRAGQLAAPYRSVHLAIVVP